MDAALPLANWHRRGALLEDCLLGDGVLLRELVGIVDGYCGKRFEGRSTELTGHTASVWSICAMGDISVFELAEKIDCPLDEAKGLTAQAMREMAEQRAIDKKLEESRTALDDEIPF